MLIDKKKKYHLKDTLYCLCGSYNHNSQFLVVFFFFTKYRKKSHDIEEKGHDVFKKMIPFYMVKQSVYETKTVEFDFYLKHICLENK